ncbi:MAG TPA: hypothetical protein VG326_14850, partial [Tepidisphaeraceae bacterium]|nr:hypothetical protein [Tepidisphaeraceae bacterium]
MDTETLELHSPGASARPVMSFLDGARSSERERLTYHALTRARQALLDLQKPSGYWVGELQG